MRLPFNLSDQKFEDGARVKFQYSSSELKQNIEISLDGEDASVEALVDAFERFLSALGISIPENVALGFVELEDDEEEDEETEENDN